MLGSDPIAALLGAATDHISTQTVWKAYLRKLVSAGAAVTMLGPDVVIPEDATAEEIDALTALIALYPPCSNMPPESTGVLAEAGVVDTQGDRVNRRVASYWRHIARVLGNEMMADLLAREVVIPSVGLHVGASGMVAVTVPDADALSQWRSWSGEVSGDRRERHSAPTLQLPRIRGGGVYLFRTFEPVPAVDFGVAGCAVNTGDLVVPIPPTHQSGKPVYRLGPARMLPNWLRAAIDDQPVSGAVHCAHPELLTTS